MFLHSCTMVKQKTIILEIQETLGFHY
jgi:hypothetical protein